jgi:hypothetical protein
MNDYDKEKWLGLYHAALGELEHAKISGRIGDTRTEIVARLEKLHSMTALIEERQAIFDALSTLRFLEREEERYDADEKRRLLDKALHALRSVAPKPSDEEHSR